MKIFMKLLGGLLLGLACLIGAAFFIGVVIGTIYVLAMPWTTLTEHDLEARVFTFCMGILLVFVVLGFVYLILYEIANPSRGYIPPLPLMHLRPKPQQQKKKPILGDVRGSHLIAEE